MSCGGDCMKKLVIPLQAFAALFLCAGMAWMVFVLAGVNPTPPTAADLQACNTQELSFANMNSTAVALAQQMLVNMIPSSSGSIFLPVTGRETATPTPSAVVTLKPVFTNVASPTPSSYFITPTATRKKIDTAAPTMVRPPTETATSVPTHTDMPRFTTVPTQPVPTDSPTQLPTAVPTEASPTEPPTTVPTEFTAYP